MNVCTSKVGGTYSDPHLAKLGASS